MKESVGIGIIGTGFARRVQAPAFLSCRGARITSVASGNIDNARAAAAEAGAAHYTDDWKETAARDDVDLVCITTPPSMHRDMALFAIEHGKHVLCEKPMAMNVAEAEEMTRAAAEKPTLSLIDHELRFQPGRLRAYSMLREGSIGKIRHVKCIFQAPHRGDPNIKWNWWSDIKQGGGALGAIASHIIDSLHWFLGADISIVSCQLQTHIKQRKDAAGEVRAVTSDDESNMLIRFNDKGLCQDTTGLISVSMTESPEYRNRMEFYGSEGAMRVDHLGELSISAAGEETWRPIDVDLGTPVPGVADTGFARAFMSFAPRIVDAILEGKTEIEHAATFENGLKVQRVLDAARESNEHGRRVSVNHD